MEVEVVVPRLLSVTGPTSEAGGRLREGEGGKACEKWDWEGLQGRVRQLVNLRVRAATVILSGLCVTR